VASYCISYSDILDSWSYAIRVNTLAAVLGDVVASSSPLFVDSPAAFSTTFAGCGRRAA